jgi:amidohydrolase
VNNPISVEAGKVFAASVAIRRRIHANPELATREFATAKLVRETLVGMGCTAEYCCKKTGVVGVLENGEGKTVALRADLDALPITEKTGLSFASVVPGVSHACGHDIHIACLLGAAQALASRRDLWRGRVVFLFQPSEEMAPGGAITMIQEGVFPKDASAVFGLHVNPEHPCGTVGLISGPDYAGVVDFDIVIQGRGSHGAMPERAIDPIVCASACILALQTLVSRESPPQDPSVVTVGKIEAGTKHNIIPSEARFYGTIRAFSDKRLETLKRRVRDVVRSTAHSFRAIADVSFEEAYPPGYNDPDATERAIAALGAVLGKSRVVRRSIPTMLAEDFAYFQREAPGVYVHLGVRSSGAKDVPGIHTADFTPDERSVETGIAVHTALAIDVLKK